MTDDIEAVLAKLSPEGAAIARAVLAQTNLYGSNIDGPIDIESPDYDLAILKEKPLGVQICTRLPAKDAVELMCEQHSTGTSSGWALDEDEPPVACQSHPDTHTHYILYC